MRPAHPGINPGVYLVFVEADGALVAKSRIIRR